METLLIALGGNALMSPRERQMLSSEIGNAKRAVKGIVELAKTRRYRIVVTHGNGPQVGDELVRNEHARDVVPQLPLYMLNAETQASIGEILETALIRELGLMHVKKAVSVLLTHAVVSRNDPAFKRPTKPVGPVYTKAGLKMALKAKRFSFVKTAGGGYRRVVASPRPTAVLESETIKRLAISDIVIAGGGGGIPVIKKHGSYVGVEAVIDKDLTSQVLASSIGASKMIILTDVDYVYGNLGKKRLPILEMKAREIRRLLGRFEEGTMRPKLDACARFVEEGGAMAYIGSLFRLGDIVRGRSGTRII